MDLILWRHAEAEEIHRGQLDSERALTPKGRRQATKMSLWLRAHLPKDTQVIVSPARRTQETAAQLGLPFSTDHRLAIDQSPNEALSVANWASKSGCCLLVGHQPMLGQIIGDLLQSQVAEWSVKKGSIWWFSANGHVSEKEQIDEGEGMPTDFVLKCVLNVKDIESRKS